MATFPIDEFKNIETPFYYYDMELLRLTLDEVKKQAGGSKVHYAVKANANPRILAAVREAGLGVDCVSGGEIVAALNAGFSGGDLSATYTMTGIIQQMIAVIEGAYGITLAQDSVNVARFITHLRYLFVRIHQHEQLDDEPQPIIESIKTSYPKACQCARQLAVVVKMRLGSDLTEAEIAYLALHVARVTNGVNRQVD